MTHPVHIPANVDREDRIVANLTARQVLILALTGIALYLAWAATRTLLPLAVFALVAVPVAAGRPSSCWASATGCLSTGSWSPRSANAPAPGTASTPPKG